MALHFLTSTNQTFEVVVTCDPSVDCTKEQRDEYLNTGDLSKLDIGKDATRFTLKPLGPADREAAEIRAGAFSRSELGRYLWIEAPSEAQKRRVGITIYQSRSVRLWLLMKLIFHEYPLK